jgi:predicted nucleic acid-binding protein
MATRMTDGLVVDTNVLVYALRSGSPFHQQACTALLSAEAKGHGLWVTRQILREFCTVLLKPEPGLVRVTPSAAASGAIGLTQRYAVADETEDVTSCLLGLVAKYELNWKLVHDANIVATMLTFGLGTLLTNNADDFVWAKDLVRVISLTDAS